MSIFSRPATSPPLVDILTPDIKQRILHTLAHLSQDSAQPFLFEYMLDHVRTELLKRHGRLNEPIFQNQIHPSINHFLSTEDDKAKQFIVLCFRSFHNPGQEGVEAINQIFKEEKIPYELTPYVEIGGITDESKLDRELNRHEWAQPLVNPQHHPIEIQYPEIINREEHYLHEEATQPAFEVLQGKQYQGANEEFLSAHSHFTEDRTEVTTG